MHTTIPAPLLTSQGSHHRYAILPGAHDLSLEDDRRNRAALYCAAATDVWGICVETIGGASANVYTTRRGVEALRDQCNAILATFPVGTDDV